MEAAKVKPLKEIKLGVNQPKQGLFYGPLLGTGQCYAKLSYILKSSLSMGDPRQDTGQGYARLQH